MGLELLGDRGVLKVSHHFGLDEFLGSGGGNLLVHDSHDSRVHSGIRDVGLCLGVSDFAYFSFLQLEVGLKFRKALEEFVV